MKNIVSLILENAFKWLSNKCVIYQNDSITYLDLLHRTKGISFALKQIYYNQYKKNTGNDELIAIIVDKDLELIPIMLGIMTVGAGYLPIDPNLPVERIEYILKNSGANFCIVKTELIGKIQNLNVDTLILDQADLIEESRKYKVKDLKDKGELVNILVKNLLPSSLAYTIYTSGSTGDPKGVMINHSSLLNLVNYQVQFFNINTRTKCLGFANISFDASVWEYFSTLASGGAIVFDSKESILPGENLENTLKKYKITNVTLPPSALALTNPISLNDLMVVISAGEKLTDHVISIWAGKDFKFYNAYGPTEATICSTIKQVFPGTNASIIGKSFANSLLYVVTENTKNELVKNKGKVGELYIGGPGVAMGYLNNEELTQKSFVCDKGFCDYIVYKTGDLVQINVENEIEYVGRIDNQVKIRGYRIELEEIEQKINLLSTVKSSIAVGYNDSLFAFIEFKDNKMSMRSDTLRSFLQEKLPDYMVPSTFIKVDKFPYTNNGKIDRNKLINDLIASESKNNGFELTHTEKTIIEICRELLQNEDIKITDNFFQLGGHSLLMTRVILSIRKKLNINININEFITTKSLKELANIVDSK